MEYSYSSFYKKWSLITSAVNVIGLIYALWSLNYHAWILAIVLLFGLYLSKITNYIPKLPLYIGYANWVSTLRLIIILISFTFYPHIENTYLFILFLFAICLDGIDGYLARRYKHSSEPGGNFDMEIDAFLVLILSFIHVSGKKLDWLILIPGSLRYSYELLLFWLPKNNKEMLPKKIRATIAVSFFLSLLIPFLTTSKSYIFITYVSGFLIVCSFIVSIISQLNPRKK